MLWEIVKFYLLMDLAGFLTSILVMSGKEIKYAIKTEGKTRLYRFSDYMKLYCHNSDVVFNTELLPYDKTIKFLGHTIFVNDLSDYKK
jgi:hypothetical protein